MAFEDVIWISAWKWFPLMWGRSFSKREGVWSVQGTTKSWKVKKKTALKKKKHLGTQFIPGLIIIIFFETLRILKVRTEKYESWHWENAVTRKGWIFIQTLTPRSLIIRKYNKKVFERIKRNSYSKALTIP